jgi:hypothetical protein
MQSEASGDQPRSLNSLFPHWFSIRNLRQFQSANSCSVTPAKKIFTPAQSGILRPNSPTTGVVLTSNRHFTGSSGIGRSARSILPLATKAPSGRG